MATCEESLNDAARTGSTWHASSFIKCDKAGYKKAAFIGLLAFSARLTGPGGRSIAPRNA